MIPATAMIVHPVSSEEIVQIGISPVIEIQLNGDLTVSHFIDITTQHIPEEAEIPILELASK